MYSYICISEYDQSIKPFKFKLQGKKKAFILIRKPKESPRRGIDPRSPVTDGDTLHYTAEELDALNVSLMVYVMGKRPLPF